MFKTFIIATLLLTVIACGSRPSATSDTPTDAYKRHFAAVKSKEVEAIKVNLSKRTIDLAVTTAARSKTDPQMPFINGFTRTTFGDTLPEIRDERMMDKMGALEVWNATDGKWEDIPFILEDSKWKLAVGDAFAGAWVRPGQGRDTREKVAANSMNGNNVIPIQTPGSLNDSK